MCHISEDHYLNLHRSKCLKLQMSKSIRKANTMQDNFLLHVVWIAEKQYGALLIYAIVLEFHPLFYFMKSHAKLQVRYCPFISLVCANQIDIPCIVVSAKGLIINKLSTPTSYGRLQRIHTKNTSITKSEVKFVQDMKAHRRSRGMATFILNRGARWKWLVRFMIYLPHHWERTTVPME